jgi:hypothetical protein
MPLHVNESCRKGQTVAGRDDDNGNDSQAHECTDPAHRADMSLDKTTATATASVSTDAAVPHPKPPAKATWDHIREI